MDHSLIENNVNTMDNSSSEVAEELVEIVDQVAPASEFVPSYRPTKWAFVNSTLDRVDVITKGRAGSLMKFVTFLVIGGFTSVINLVIADVIWSIPLPLSEALQNLIGTLIGIEISLIVNFMLNDKFTFNDTSGHDRPWLARLSRFHVTALGGQVLTLGLQAGFSDLLHLSKLISLAISIIIVLFYNFTFHHFFTYRHLKTIEEAV
jgi:putative flippase GtrA